MPNPAEDLEYLQNATLISLCEAMVSHLRYHATLPPEPEPVAVPFREVKVKKSRHVCRTCHKVCGNRAGLKLHMRYKHKGQ